MVMAFEGYPERLLGSQGNSKGNSHNIGVTPNQGLSASYVLTEELNKQIFPSHDWKPNLGFLNRGVSYLHGSNLLKEVEASCRDHQAGGSRRVRRLDCDPARECQVTETGYRVGATISRSTSRRCKSSKSSQKVCSLLKLRVLFARVGRTLNAAQTTGLRNLASTQLATLRRAWSHLGRWLQRDNRPSLFHHVERRSGVLRYKAVTN